MQAAAQSLKVDPSRPIKALFETRTLVPVAERPRYFATLQEFAAANGLRVNIRLQYETRDWHVTDMLGEHVVAMGSNFRDPRVFTIAFLPALGDLPSQATIDALRVDLLERIKRVSELTLIP